MEGVVKKGLLVDFYNREREEEDPPAGSDIKRSHQTVRV